MLHSILCCPLKWRVRAIKIFKGGYAVRDEAGLRGLSTPSDRFNSLSKPYLAGQALKQEHLDNAALGAEQLHQYPQ